MLVAEGGKFERHAAPALNLAVNVWLRRIALGNRRPVDGQAGAVSEFGEHLMFQVRLFARVGHSPRHRIVRADISCDLVVDTRTVAVRGRALV